LRPPEISDLLAISSLLEIQTRRYLLADLRPPGRALLHDYNRPGAIGARWARHGMPVVNPALVAIDAMRLVGYGAVRDRTHITQLFVSDEYRGRGLGYRLTMALIGEILKRDPSITWITLNAAPSAITAYLRMGFQTSWPRFVKDGIVAQPMGMEIG
jgi:GNAT superfamily N-acetyltransferase